MSHPRAVLPQIADVYVAPAQLQQWYPATIIAVTMLFAWYAAMLLYCTRLGALHGAAEVLPPAERLQLQASQPDSVFASSCQPCQAGPALCRPLHPR